MRNRLVLLGVAILLLAGGSWVVSTQSLPHRPMVAHKVKGDLYMIEGQGGNVAAYVTSEGVILVDDMYDENHGEIMATVKSLTAQPIKYVLNTHQHSDHAGGNVKMLAVADVIAHGNVRANMAKRAVAGMPRVTFSDEMSVHLGGKEVRARYHGRGHTDGDVFVYFPEVGAVHTGDMFLTNTSTLQPYIDYANGGAALAWPATLDSVLKMEFDAVIPGHGPLSNRAGMVRWQSTFKTMLDRVRGMVREGRSKDAIAQMLVKDYEFQPAAIKQLDALLAELK
jgi:glyoxylase-like metal-dependent hydrolase (beta-lactamase superfamily II)